MITATRYVKLPDPLPVATELDRARVQASGPLVMSPRRGHAALQRQIESRLDRDGFVVLHAPPDRRSLRIVEFVVEAFAGRNLHCVIPTNGPDGFILAKTPGPAVALLDAWPQKAEPRGFRRTTRPPSGPAAGRPSNR